MIKSVIVGIIFGAICAILKVPLPAPSELEGVIAILGLCIGYLTVEYIRSCMQ